MYGYIEGVSTGTKHGTSPQVLLVEADNSAKGREVPGAAVRYGA